MESTGLKLYFPYPLLRYFTDSLNNRIYMYDYDDGKLSNKRLFVDTLAIGLPSGTFPDGLCIDSEGGVWSARFVASSLSLQSCYAIPPLQFIYAFDFQMGRVESRSSFQKRINRFPDRFSYCSKYYCLLLWRCAKLNVISSLRNLPISPTYTNPLSCSQKELRMTSCS